MAVRRYETPGVTVLWDSSRCIHVAACIGSLPEVFDPRERPWVRPERAEASELMRAIRRCPTGALRYERKDGGAAEQGRPETSIIPVPNGPLVLRGQLNLVTFEGETIAQETRVALCRCGATGNAPFCDGSHYTSGWHSHDPGVRPRASAAREAAASPADVGAPQEEWFPDGDEPAH